MSDAPDFLLDLTGNRRYKCTSCGKNFRTARSAYLHWLGAHSRYKLRGEGERAVLLELAEARKGGKT